MGLATSELVYSVHGVAEVVHMKYIHCASIYSLEEMKWRADAERANTEAEEQEREAAEIRQKRKGARKTEENEDAPAIPSCEKSPTSFNISASSSSPLRCFQGSFFFMPK